MIRIKQFAILTALLFVTGIGLLACNPSEFPLSTDSNPTAGGSIVPAKGSYAKGVPVSVTATPSAGYRFDHWEGGASGSAPTMQVTMDSPTHLVAFFTKTFSLTASPSPAPGGTVTPASGSFDQGSKVNLIASPAQYYAFNGWAGDISGNADHLTVTMDSNKQITASFIRQLVPIQIQYVPPVGGTTDFTNGNYEAGSQKTITASPAVGYRFDHWGGLASGTNNPVNVTLDNNNIIAYFTRVYTLALSVSPTDGGTINATNGVYDAGSKVVLSATPLFPYYPNSWTGADNNNVFPTTVTMNNNMSVTAVFAQTTKTPLQHIEGNVAGGDLAVGPPHLPVASISIDLKRYEWVQGDIKTGTNPPVYISIKDPSGKVLKDFGAPGQANFAFMAETAGPYTIVFTNNSMFWSAYFLDYTVYKVP